jgi:hypothetical protein
LIVVDSYEDSTFTTLREIEDPKIRLRKLISTYGTGPANAIRFGVNSAETGIVVITMADGSDDPRDIATMSCIHKISHISRVAPPALIHVPAGALLRRTFPDPLFP